MNRYILKYIEGAKEMNSTCQDQIREEIREWRKTNGMDECIWSYLYANHYDSQYYFCSE